MTYVTDIRPWDIERRKSIISKTFFWIKKIRDHEKKIKKKKEEKMSQVHKKVFNYIKYFSIDETIQILPREKVTRAVDT